ncbi:MAG: PQQ-binding-like beta-propeller repeat protein [Planctomyces sp.]|jgi:outer membrane protein assembly factor BamB|nr:PQQ-like beta-propeller repeat protein [Planctomyces sp.]
MSSLRLLALVCLLGTAVAEDWPHWRGPNNDGHSFESGLPEKWSPKGENLLWRRPEYASRATPVVMNDRVYLVCRAFPETTQEGEKTVCVNAKTGELIWESVHNIYLSDAPAERVGWSSVVADPQTDTVFVLGLGCVFQCLDGKTGRTIWEHSMSEEYGMLSTYGGRTNFPVVFEDLVIISGVMTGWGENAVPAHRMIAFDKKTGVARWLISTRVRPEDTTYTTPVFTTFRGQAAMVFSAADGAIYAVQPRTGKVIWKYQASTRGINSTPVVDADGIVYAGHAEQNSSDTNVLGAVFAFDGNVEGEITEDKLLWKAPKRALGRSSLVKLGDRIYFIEDGAALVILDAKTGALVGQKKLGRIMFGSPMVAGGKLYVAENTGRFYVLKPTEKGVDVASEARLAQGEEVFGSPAASNGRIFLPTIEALYCIGSATAAASKPTATAVSRESALSDRKVAQVLLTPTEQILKPGEKLQLQVLGYNKAGQLLGPVKGAVVTAEGGGAVSADLVYTAPASGVAGVVLTAKSGELAAKARLRVIPQLPWKFDFADEKVPPVWIGADYRHKPAPLDGQKGLVKISTIPKGTRSQAWLGWTNLHDYTIQADFKATQRGDRLPDMGLINQRYTLDLQGAQRLQIRSWTARLELRFAKTMDFNWQADTWYTMKFRSETEGGKVTLRGKVWKRGESEPSEWQIEATDEVPNLQGSPGLFGNATDAEFFVDNVAVSSNQK